MPARTYGVPPKAYETCLGTRSPRAPTCSAPARLEAPREQVDLLERAARTRRPLLVPDCETDVSHDPVVTLLAGREVSPCNEIGDFIRRAGKKLQSRLPAAKGDGRNVDDPGIHAYGDGWRMRGNQDNVTV